MSTTSLAPLSPTSCAHLAAALLEDRYPTNSLWSFSDTGPAPLAILEEYFEVVDDLVGVRLVSRRGVALIVDSTIDGASATTCLVQSRCGCFAVAIRWPNGVVVGVDASGGAEGFVCDTARRILGLDCAVEPTHPIEVIHACWLTTVLDYAADPQFAFGTRTWDDLVALHPLAIASALRDRTGIALEPDELAARVYNAVSWWSWEWLHEQSIALEMSPLGVCEADNAPLDGDQLRWMDPPMFARWTLAVHRGVADLLDDCSLFLEPTLLERLHCAVRTTRR